MKQMKFDLPMAKTVFGGSLLKGNPKVARPLATRLPIHVTLRALTGGMRQPKAFAQIEEQLRKTSKKYGVRIYRHANVGNHIHLLIKLTRREFWAAFIRELTSRIAALGRIKWKFRPHTRILQWGKAFDIACEYVYLNQMEAEGNINQKETKTIKDLRAIFSG